jgi:hypothetical protein
VTDVAWRDANVRAGWARLTSQWAGRWPDAVRRFAWPHELPGSPRHPAALAFAGDLVAHPQLVTAWTRTFAADDAKLVVYGPGADMAVLGAQLEALFRELGLEAGSIDVLALSSPEADPPPLLLASVAAVVATARPGGAAAALPRVDEHSLERLPELAAGATLVS